ncbi:uncharacterized protein [Dermacentor andersoni]|uniref:uncharacterized protein isoform X1 n=2 Tax=Dermacentor andersoni TaxID=34620 RepID=UPI003B3B3AB1
MTSSSSVRELPPGDPKLTASIVSHLKSRGLFDKLRRDCLGDVDTKPAYLNLKQRIEGYITKFLSTQTWTPDMNKNHVRDMMRREINESGMLSAGMDHLVDQIVNPKIYHVFTPEVENGVRQYLGLSSEKDSSTQQPAAETLTDFISQPPPPQTSALPPPPPKSEFSIDETTQDVPGSCSPKPYTEALMPDGLMDSSSEHQLMIVTESNEHTEDIPAELPVEKAESYDFCETSAEPVDPAPNEASSELPTPVDALESDSPAISQSGSADDKPVTENVELPASLDNMKPDSLKNEPTVNEFDRKDNDKVAAMTKMEVKPTDKDKKERKVDSVKGKESCSHSGRSESHSRNYISRKNSDISRSKMQKSNKCDGDSSRESRDLLKEKDKYSTSRDRGNSSREETQRNRADVTKDERSKGYSSQSSRSKDSDSRNERKRLDDKHRHYSSSQRNDDRKRHSDRHSREDKSRDRSDSHRSHSESRREKDRCSTKDSSRQQKSSKSSEKHGESSRKEKSHEKEKKQAYNRQSTFDSKDSGTSKKMLSEKVLQPISCNLFQATDDASFHMEMQESFRSEPPELNANPCGSSQQDYENVCEDSPLAMVEHVSQDKSEENISCDYQIETKVSASMSGEISQETSSKAYDERSHGALQLVEAKEAEILRFSYVSDKQFGSSGADLQLVSTITEKQAEGMQNEAPTPDNEVHLENNDQASSSSFAAPLEQKSPTVEDGPEASRRKTTTEKHSPEKKRPKREASDGHETDGAWSDVTVSSVHTSDLSSYDDRISVSSGDEDDNASSRERKKIPLREIKKITSSSNEDDDRLSRSETEHCVSDGVVPPPASVEQVTEQHEPTPAKEPQPPCPVPYESSSTGRGLSNSPSTDVSDGTAKPKMGLRRTRKINPKYVSEEFSSIFTEGKRPTGTIDFSELAKYGKEKHHEERSSLRTEPRKAISREDTSEDTAAAMSCDETDQLSDASVNDRTRRPARRSSGSEPRARSESVSSKCYQSSDLYKPRPVIKPGTRRSRPSSSGVDTSKKQRGLKVCIGFKRGRASTAGSSRRKRL